MTEATYKIGQTFIRSGKLKALETVTDILTTTNAKGEIFKIEYATEHLLMGQIVKSVVNKTTIDIGIYNQKTIENRTRPSGLSIIDK